MYISKTTITKMNIMKTTTKGFLFGFQGEGKWSTPKGEIQWSGFGLTGGGGDDLAVGKRL